MGLTIAGSALAPMSAGVVAQAGLIPGDVNGDADVDGDDFTLFLPCMAGAGVPLEADALPPGCALTADAAGRMPADGDRDGDVDQDDFGLLQRCFSGPATPANPACVSGTWLPMPGDRQWARQTLVKECDYIADCSFSEDATNHAAVAPDADGYGVLNDNRIHWKGPDWVRPGEAAMGAIGLMAGARKLHGDSVSIGRYDRILDRFFQTWLLQRRQPIVADAGDDRGAICSDVEYDALGKREGCSGPNAAVTGQMIVTMWKYGQYKRAIGRASLADQWLQDAWPAARDGGEFIARHVNTTHQMVRSNSSGEDLWLTDAVFSAAAMRTLALWSEAAGQSPVRDYAAAATVLSAGVRAMADAGVWKGFFRYRDASGGYMPCHGDQIDQLCFLPYEAGVLDAGDPLARSISDFWTVGDRGSSSIRMTPHTADPTDWRFYGTHLHHYFDTARPENQLLSPGAGLQLARMEWRQAVRTGDLETLQRAWWRFLWVADSARSGLWFGVTGEREAGVGNGIVDWRRVDDRTQSAQGYERFLDTSAYFIEVVLMLYHGIDTSYMPD
ncbi:MAG: hypothetical protein KA354_06190 [Phycisphaerae bacterium]|nr:hypothetical protein [Phycisphaerae bacterium]